MRIFVEYSKTDFDKALEATKLKGGLNSVVVRTLVKLGKEPVRKNCVNRCNKIKRSYTIPDCVVENIQTLADNDGISVAHYIQKKIIYPLIH